MFRPYLYRCLISLEYSIPVFSRKPVSCLSVPGILLSLKRILTCHPIKFLGGGEGFDPVQKKMENKK